MVRECRPPAREPVRSWLARRSTMATSTPANASSPANISPVGPPPATTTACSAIRHLHPRRFWFRPEILQNDYEKGFADLGGGFNMPFLSKARAPLAGECYVRMASVVEGGWHGLPHPD